MPLFQLPFYLNNIEQGVAAGFAVGISFWVVMVLAEKRIWHFRGLIDIFLAWRFRMFSPERRFRIFKIGMTVMSAIMLAVAGFYLLVWIGIIQNGDPPAFPSMEDLAPLFPRKSN